MNATVPVVLTIAGSDSGGGAGIQADLKTFAALGVFGTSALTCLTAQNPDEVTGVQATDPDMVALQVRTVCAGFPVSAAKTGMVYSAPIIRAVAEAVSTCAITNLVVDPVMAATSGARLLREDAIEALQRELIPRASVITPNVPEAEILCGESISSVEDLERAAKAIGEQYGVACVAKGGHLGGDEIVDVLYADGRVQRFSSPRIQAVETHGTGCTFSAALAACLAKGLDLVEAVGVTREFVASALAGAVRIGEHYPLGIKAM